MAQSFCSLICLGMNSKVLAIFTVSPSRGESAVGQGVPGLLLE